MTTSLRQYSFIDHLVMQLDQGIRTVFAPAIEARKNPAAIGGANVEHVGWAKESVSFNDRRAHQLSSRLMRVNHAGEISAQALYHAQALTAKSPQVALAMQQAAAEENDHLAWCEQRLKELDEHTSYLNPLWYMGSFMMGICAGLAGDKWNLGFLAETERQVVNHLDKHLAELPLDDQKSRLILEQMREDEAHHATTACTAGAAELPVVIKKMMRGFSKVMTQTAYWI